MAGIKISILMLTFNNEIFIEESLASIVKQDVGNHELDITIWDNASLDKTIEIAEKCLSSVGIGYRIVRELRNTYLEDSNFFFDAIRAVRGDYIAIIDGDDAWTDTSKLKTQIEFLEANPSILICGTLAEQFNVATNSIDFLIPHESQVGVFPGYFLARDNILVNSTVVFRRRMVNRLTRELFKSPIKDLPTWAVGVEDSEFAVLNKLTTRYNFNHGTNVSTKKSKVLRLVDEVETYARIISELRTTEYREAWISGMRELINRRCDSIIKDI